MMIYVPLKTRVRMALLSVLANNMITELTSAGYSFLTPQAFAPLPAGALTGDHIAVTGLGTVRADDAREGLRLTTSSRDKLYYYAIEIWCFGATDTEAQDHAEACEFAATQLLDRPDHLRLGGLLEQPLTVGNTEALSAEDEDRQSLVWHLAMPVACRVRTTRPERLP